MTRRLNLATQAMLPWEIPELDAALAGDSAAASTAEKKIRPVTAKALEAARLEIEEQRRKGHAEGLEHGMAEGQKKGYAAGVEQGQRVTQQRLAEQMRRLDAASKNPGEPIRALDRPVEDAVIALGLEVARRVIG